MKIFFSHILFFLSLATFGQQNTYRATDEMTATAGAMPDENLATITQRITVSFSGKEQKARAIFYWITHHISIDPKATKRNDQRNIKPEEIIQARTATPLGYSLLFQEMCSQANIRCLSVDGYTKNSAEDINNPADAVNHSWNVVQLGQSPDTWFYVDVAKGSGFLNKSMTEFTPSFGSNYFFTNPEVFNLDHFPDNEAWRLGNGPKSLSAFYAMPVIYTAGNSLNLYKLEPKNGMIKTKPSRAVAFKFFHYQEQEIKEIKLVAGEDKRAGIPELLKFSDTGGVISLTYTFKREDEYPVTFYADGRAMITYIINSEE